MAPLPYKTPNPDMMKSHSIYASFTLKITACLAVLFGMAACADEPDSCANKSMGFNCAFADASRATTQIPLDGEKYTLWANANFLAEDATTAVDYFASNFLQFTYNAATNSYIATNYYFPLSGKMCFTAYASNKSTCPAPAITKSGASISKLVFDLTSGDGLTEVVYTDYSDVTCPVTATPSLCFHRTQTNLRFKFIPADEYTCKHVIINSIEIKDVQWKGKINLSYDTSGKATLSWTNTAAKATYTFNVVPQGTVPVENADTRMKWDTANDKAIPLDIEDGLHMLPKTDGRTQIIIRYTMLNDPTATSAGGVGGAVDEDLLGRPNDDYRRNLTYVIDAESAKNWEAYTQYYYNITVHGNAQMDVEKVAVKAVEDGPTGTMEI